MTIYRTYRPHAPLAAFIDTFWLYEGHDLQHTKERRLPDGSMELVINLRDDMIRVYDRQHHDLFKQFRGCVFSGAYSEYFMLDTACQLSIIGVHFKPGGAFPFFNMPASELHNTHVSLDTLWGTIADDVRAQLLATRTAEEKFGILERTFLAHTTTPPVRHPAVSFALNEFQNSLHLRTIADVTKQIGVSQRHFIQVFCREVGLTPKLFCRIQRFQKVLRFLEKGQRPMWTDLALSCGYFDQAHCIHDFQTFSGLAPSMYLTQRGEHTNHVPLKN